MTAAKNNKRRENNMNKALQSIKYGMSYRQAAKKFRLPLSTLHYRMTTPLRKPGRKTALSVQQENHIVQFLLRFAHVGIPLTQKHLREAIASVIATFSPAERIMLPFKGSMPSNGYLRAFTRRHAHQLKFAKPVIQEAKRFSAVNAEVLTTHFATLEKLIQENNIDECRLFNLDEVGISPGKDANGKLVCRRFMPKKGNRDCVAADFSYEDRITMMPVISAAGETGPPLFVFKGKRMLFRNHLFDGKVFTETPASCLPRDAVVATRAELGGVDTENFLSWSQAFLRYTRDLRAQDRKILLVYDGYRSHLSLQVLKKFFNNNVIVYALPSHTSGKTQPLDTVLFSAFKGALNTTVHHCTGVDDSRGIDVFGLCKIIRLAYKKSFTNENIKSSFMRSGIWPLDATSLLGEPRPADSSTNARILDVDELSALFIKKRREMQNQILGEDATVLQCGYVDTRNGCVMTSNYVMELVHKKKQKEERKKRIEEEQRILKDLKAARRHEKERKECSRLRLAQNVRRARAAGTTMDVYLKSLRSMKERRGVAKMRTFRKHILANDVA